MSAEAGAGLLWPHGCAEDEKMMRLASLPVDMEAMTEVDGSGTTIAKPKLMAILSCLLEVQRSPSDALRNKSLSVFQSIGANAVNRPTAALLAACLPPLLLPLLLRQSPVTSKSTAKQAAASGTALLQGCLVALPGAQQEFAPLIVLLNQLASLIMRFKALLGEGASDAVCMHAIHALSLVAQASTSLESGLAPLPLPVVAEFLSKEGAAALSRLLTTLRQAVDPRHSLRLPGSVLLALVNALALLPRHSDSLHPPVLSACLAAVPAICDGPLPLDAQQPSSPAGPASSPSLRHLLRQHLLGLLRCMPGSAPQEAFEELVAVLRRLVGPEAVESVVRQRERALRSQLRGRKDSRGAGAATPAAAQPAKWRSRSASDGPDSTEEAVPQQPGTLPDPPPEAGAPPRAPPPGESASSPLAQVVAMMGAMLDRGGPAAQQAVDQLVESFSPDMLADVVIAVMEHLPASAGGEAGEGAQAHAQAAPPAAAAGAAPAAAQAAQQAEQPALAAAATPPATAAASTDAAAAGAVGRDAAPGGGATPAAAGKRDPRRDPRRRATAGPLEPKAEEESSLALAASPSAEGAAPSPMEGVQQEGAPAAPAPAAALPAQEEPLEAALAAAVGREKVAAAAAASAALAAVPPESPLHALWLRAPRSAVTLLPLPPEQRRAAVRAAEQRVVAVGPSAVVLGRAPLWAHTVCMLLRLEMAGGGRTEELLSALLPSVVADYAGLKGSSLMLSVLYTLWAHRQQQQPPPESAGDGPLDPSPAQVYTRFFVKLVQALILASSSSSPSPPLPGGLKAALLPLLVEAPALPLAVLGCLAALCGLRERSGRRAAGRKRSRAAAGLPAAWEEEELEEEGEEVVEGGGEGDEEEEGPEEEAADGRAEDADAESGSAEAAIPPASDLNVVKEGLVVLWRLLVLRPPVRWRCLAVALRVVNRLHDLPFLSQRIESFACRQLRVLQGRAAPPGQPAPLEPSAAGAAPGTAPSAAGSGGASEARPGEGAAEGAAGGADAAQALAEDAERLAGLFCALCSKKPELLAVFFKAYADAPPPVKRVMLRSLLPPILAPVSPANPHVLQLIAAPPANAERLLIKLLNCLADPGRPAPPREFVAAVLALAQAQPQEPEVLIPVLPFLSPAEASDVLPSVMQLPPELFKFAQDKLLQGSPHTPPPYSPVELLAKMHAVAPRKDALPLKKIMQLCSSCLSQRALFTHQTTAKLLNALVDQTPLPMLLFRTMLESLSSFPDMGPYIVELLQRLVAKQVWRAHAQLWLGFIKCCLQTKPLSFPLLLQLPSSQLQDVLAREPSLRPELVAFAAQPDVQPTVPQPSLALLAPQANEAADGTPA